MRADVSEAAWDLIENHSLHASDGWVSLEPLEPLFVPVLRDLEPIGVPAFAVPAIGATAMKTPAHVVLDAHSPRMIRRLLYAHEIGHILCGHAGSLVHLELGDWWHDRDEREAWEVASVLLIPHHIFMEGLSTDEVACACGVPRWLVKMYPHGRW